MDDELKKDIISYELRDLPTENIEYDPNQPRKELNAQTALKTLRHSIEQHGVQQPIAVTEYEPGKFRIIDGHRRYLCAKELQLLLVPCLVFPELDKGQLEIRRYEMQNIRRPWKPLERSDLLLRMKTELGCKSIRELAQHINIAENSAAAYLQLREQQLHLLSRLEQHGLNDSFQLEITRLKPHLRKHAGLEVDEIIDIILERISAGQIRSSKEIRILKSAFMRIDLYGDILASYLKDSTMSTRDLEEQTLRTGFSSDIQRVMAAVAKKHASGKRFTEKEQGVLDQLGELIQQVRKVRA